MPHDDRTELLLALGRGLHQAGIRPTRSRRRCATSAVACGVDLQVNALPTSLTLAVGPAFAQRLVILRLEPGKAASAQARAARRRRRRAAARPRRRRGARGRRRDRHRGAARLRRRSRSPRTRCCRAEPRCCSAAATAEVMVSALVGVAIGAIARGRRSDRGASTASSRSSAAFVATVIVGLWERFVGADLALRRADRRRRAAAARLLARPRRSTSWRTGTSSPGPRGSAACSSRCSSLGVRLRARRRA